MDCKPVIVDAVDQKLRITVVTEAPENFAERVKGGHLVKYAKNIQKKLHCTHDIELTKCGDLKVSVLFEQPLPIRGIISAGHAISCMSDAVIDSVTAAPRFNAAIGFINSLNDANDDKEPEKPEKE